MSDWVIVGGGDGTTSGHGQVGHLERQDRDREARRLNVEAGLTPEGFASWEAPKPGGGFLGRGLYDPRDPGDVARVRSLMAEYGYPEWEPRHV